MQHSYDYNCYCHDCCNHEAWLHNMLVFRDTREPTVKFQSFGQEETNRPVSEYTCDPSGSAKGT